MALPTPLTSRLFKRILPVLGIVGLGIAAAVYFGSRHLATVPEQIAAPAPSTGSMVIDGVHQSAARDGRTEWILDARSATYFPDVKMFQLSEPNVTFFRANGQKFFLTARRGTVRTDNHDMDASEDVTIWNDTYRLEAESIRYRYADRLIESQNPVKMTTHTGDLTADTLSANLTTNRMAFSGHVQALLLAAPTPAAGAPAALPPAASDKARIQAEHLDVDMNTSAAEFSGHVHLVEKDSVITSDTLTVYATQKEGQAAPAAGALSEVVITQMIVRGQVVIRTEGSIARADEAVYEPGSGLLTLSGRDTILTGESATIRGYHMVISRKEGHLTAEGKAPERVKVVWVTQQRRP
ncbi:MAG: LPS export ABC transporter periplasmic protein LptC [Deltaproteobacteria bacterium]|nr:LPS export ABC transporter periplasmic protein LptC [Deltaproteobacteria bacterium]